MSKNSSESRLDTVIGPGTSVRGDFRVTGSLRLDGQVEGTIDVGEAFLAGPKSLLKGVLRCRDAVVAGRIEADICAQETVELQTGAHVTGNVKCRGLIIQRDSFFQGNCLMTREADAETVPHRSVESEESL